MTQIANKHDRILETNSAKAHRRKEGKMNAFNQLKIAVRLQTLVVVILVVAITAISSIAYIQASNGVEEQVRNNLQAVFASRKTELVSYMSSIQEDLEITAASGYTAEAIRSFSDGWQKLWQ